MKENKSRYERSAISKNKEKGNWSAAMDILRAAHSDCEREDADVFAILGSWFGWNLKFWILSSKKSDRSLGISRIGMIGHR